MPTTRYIDDNLSFLPSQQWTHQSQYYPGILNTTVPSGISSSHGSSSESEFSAPETCRESSNSPLRSPDTTTIEDVKGGPYLQLIEPPVESYRFRYRTELKGTHGAILGISSLRKENARKKIFPSVKLHNYNPSSPENKVIIRCSLTTADEDVQARFPHVHQLKGKGKTATSENKTVEIDDPIDIGVSSPSYQAVFGNMTILYIKKDDQLAELVEKKKRHIRKMCPQKLMFTSTAEKELLEEAQRQIAMMNLNRLNTACLKFEALEAGHCQSQYKSICPAIYSNPIKNLKSSQFSDLRICRIDKVAGSCLGREEVFIFVEKVTRKDIKVRFYEVNDCDEEIWHAYAELGEDDVHFQYAIAFRTPRYKNVEITENVQVYFQLERPSSGSRSAPKEFEYTPDPNRWRDEVRKRPRRESPPIPATVQDLSRPSTSASGALSWTWNPGLPFRNQSNSPLQCPSSSSAVTAGSDTSSAVPMDSSENSLSEINEIFKEFDEFQDFDLGLFTHEMDVEQQGAPSIPSSHSSLNELLSISSFPSGDSEVILQMIHTPDAMSKWAICNRVPDNFIQQITSEVITSTEKAQKPRSEYKCYEIDGAPAYHIKPEMGGVKTVYHQSGLEMDFQTASKLTTFHEGNQSQLHNRNRSRLTRDNIVSNVNKVLNGLLKLKKMKKIQEQDMKRYLLGTFATCVGVNDDRVLHVLASNPNFQPLMITFLNVLKMYDIAETVVNLKNSRGQTTLHLAAEKGSLQAISLLVDSGADVNARDTSLNTPAHLVANRDQNDTFHAVGHIIENNPDLTIYNGDGLTVLHLFVMKRKSDVISSIIVKSEDKNLQVDLINQPDRKQGNTALHMAVQKKYLEIVNLLLNFEDRIDVNARNFEDKTPLAYVSGETADDLKIEELLLANKADPSLVLARRDKISKELDGFKDEIDNDSLHEYDVEEVQDVDESLPSYAQEWKTDAELKLMDSNTICSVCPVLDENKNWVKLLKKLDFDEDVLHFLEMKWSPTLYLLKFVAETMPHITPEILRDNLIRINPECRKAAQYIDDMILCSMGVF